MNDITSNDMTSAPVSTRYTLWQLVRYMLALGTWGFGGPVALAGYMYRDLVERRGWISESDYKEGLALAQLMPGPLAGVTAAAIGAITGAVIVIGQRSITDWITAALALVTAGVLWRFKKLPEPVIVLAAALIGLTVHPLLKHG